MFNNILSWLYIETTTIKYVPNGMSSLVRFPRNDNLHKITSQMSYSLRVDLRDVTGRFKYAKYTWFKVASEHANYKMTLGNYSGTAGDYSLN